MRAVLLAVLATSACASAPATSAAPAEAPRPAPAATAAPAEPAEAPPPSSEAAAAPPEAAAAEVEARDVKYVVRDGALLVHVAGAVFEPKAKPIRHGAGWGVRLTVTAKAEEAPVSLFEPKQGALMIAARISGDGGKRSHGDTRDGGTERFITPGEPTKLERDWPGAKGQPALPGDTVELQVGLWGVGPDAESRRPLKKLCVVKMVVGKKTPQPVVSAPDQP